MTNEKILNQSAQLVDIAAVRSHPDNPRVGDIEVIRKSIRLNGFYGFLIVQASTGFILAGNHRFLAAIAEGYAKIPVVYVDVDDQLARQILLADNHTSDLGGYNEAKLSELLSELHQAGALEATTYTEDDVVAILSRVQADSESANSQAGAEDQQAAEPPLQPVTRKGDVWLIGKHRLICGDCRDVETVRRLFGGAQANVVITSPPYASQRKYDESSGFRPIPPDEYAGWFRAVAAGIESILAPDGSYFLNIKEHSDEGERSLYVKDLVIAHRRQWGWRFVDEFCWRNTANGVPGSWPNRLKNAWEPVFHFCKSKDIKFRPKAAGHQSDGVVVYSPDNPSAPSGSGLLGCGAEKATGIAWPSNVIETKAEGGQGSHSAPFPRALVEFFIKAFSDAGDLIFDPFMGSGTTMAAAHVLGRTGYGCELSPAYCDLIARRMIDLTGETPNLEITGQMFFDVAKDRGVLPTTATRPA